MLKPAIPTAPTTRMLLAGLAAAAQMLAIGACGTNRTTTATSAAAGIRPTDTTYPTPAGASDRDNDGDNNDDDEKVLYFGHSADAADRRALTALVERYYADAAAEDGAAACRLLVPFIAEATAERYGRSSQLRGSTCPVVLSELFRLHHRLLVGKQATMRVLGVRVEGDRALVILDLPTIREVRQIDERRIGGNWRLLELLDGNIE
jgi:hypothetical protein